MLKDSAPSTDRGESGGKAAVIVALDSSHLGARPTTPIAPPSLTGWVSHDGVRAWIEASVPGLIPGINPGYVEVATTRHDEESGDHAFLSFSHTTNVFSLSSHSP
jgi:hypothetical protein